MIPMTLVYKNSLKMNRKNKLILHGYGAYGINCYADFNVPYLSALENDWILAYAHIRGGSEKGADWHN